MRFHALLAVALLLAPLSACEDTPKSGLAVKDVPAILDAAGNASAALSVAFIGKDVVGCKVTLATSAALVSASNAAKGAIDAKDGGDVILPAISVDISACGDLPPGADIPAEVTKGLAFAKAVQPMLTLAANNAIPTDKCKLQAWVDAVIPYAFSVADAVTTELGAPDGKVEILASTVVLSACK